VTENLRDPAGDLGGGGDDTYVGVSVGGSFLGLHDDRSLLGVDPWTGSITLLRHV
jgi:hypothetical protein